MVTANCGDDGKECGECAKKRKSKLTGNANPEGHNQYTLESAHGLREKANQLSKTATAISPADDHRGAIKAHQEAAKAFHSLGDKTQAEQDQFGFGPSSLARDLHSTAREHESAAGWHQNKLDSPQKPVDQQQKARESQVKERVEKLLADDRRKGTKSKYKGPAAKGLAEAEAKKQLGLNRLTANSALTEEECDDLCDGDEECEDEEDCATENQGRAQPMGLMERFVNLFSSNAQPRHPKLGLYQGKAKTAASTGYASHRGDVKPVGTQKAKDGRDQSSITSVADINDEEIDDHEKPSGSPANLKSAAEKVGVKVSNAMPFGMGPTANPAHDATKQAASASLQTEHAPAFGHAQTAMTASAGGDSQAAAQSSGLAAKQHEKAAVGAMQDGDDSGSDQHLQAAALHRKAAAMHQATFNQSNQRGTPMRRKVTTNMPAGGAFSGAQQAGYSASQAAAMAGKLEGSYEGTGGASKEAHEATAHAERTKSAGAHRKAATAHKEAAEHHREEGNSEVAKGHSDSARYHSQKARSATRNQLMIQNLVDNGHLHPQAAPEALATLNSEDESGDGSDTDQAGGEEDDDDSDEMDGADVSEVGDTKLTGKKTMSANQWFAQAPPEVQSVVRNAIKLENRDKSQLIRRLTANAGANRDRLVRVLNQKSLDELQLLAGSLAPTTNQGPFGPQETPAPNFLGAGGYNDYSPTVNAADNDILPLPQTINHREERAQA